MAIAALRFNNPFDVSLPIAGYNGAGDTVGIQGQPGFGSFPDMATGYQAGVQRLNSYITGQSSHGPKRTIKELNSVYATDPNWASGVAAHSGIDPDATLDPNNADQMRQLQYGVLAQEMGPKNAQLIFGQNNGGASPALAFAGNDGDTGGVPAVAPKPTSGPLSFGGDNGDNVSSKSDNRLSIGDLFGASDATKAKMHGIGAQLMRAAAALSSGVNPRQSAELNASAKAAEDANQPNMQYVMGPNGQLIRINKDTGEASFATLPGGAKGNFGVVMGKDAVGNPVPLGKIDHNTGDYTPYGQSQGGGQATNGMYGVPATEDNPYGLPDSIDDLKASGTAGATLAKQAEAINSGAMKLPNASRTNKENQAIRAAAFKYGNTTDENKFTARNTIYKNLNNKSQSQLGGQLTQLGHSGDIMAQLGEDAEGLHNSSYRLANAIPAAIGNNSPAYQAYAGKAAAFDQKADGLIGELSKLYNGSQGGGVAERAIMRQNTPRASDPPEIIASKLQALRDLYESRKNEMEQQIRAPFADNPDGGDSVIAQYLPKSVGASLSRSDASISNLHAGTKAQAAPTLDKGWKYLGSK